MAACGASATACEPVSGYQIGSRGHRWILKGSNVASSGKHAIAMDSDHHHPLTGLTATGLSRVSSMSSLS